MYMLLCFSFIVQAISHKIFAYRENTVSFMF